MFNSGFGGGGGGVISVLSSFVASFRCVCLICAPPPRRRGVVERKDVGDIICLPYVLDRKQLMWSMLWRKIVSFMT